MKTNLPLIFYADDDAAFLHLFQLGNGEHGPTYQIKCFKNGDALIESMQKLHQSFSLLPHLILLDLNMPGKDGKETLIELKAHEDFGHIPVAIISDIEDVELQKEVLDLGAEVFIPKPMAYTGIADIINEIDEHLLKEERKSN
ncbi:MAG: response regulator [Bacteroidota bacterium]